VVAVEGAVVQGTQALTLVLLAADRAALGLIGEVAEHEPRLDQLRAVVTRAVVQRRLRQITPHVSASARTVGAIGSPHQSHGAPGPRDASPATTSASDGARPACSSPALSAASRTAVAVLVEDQAAALAARDDVFLAL
jgi:hypothetical protein